MEPRQPVIVRLPANKHAKLKSYGLQYGFPMQVILENLIDQLLAQVAPDDKENPSNDDS